MLVEQARDLTRVAAELGLILLERIDLLDHVDRDHDRIVGKRVERACVVEQHVRVEDVILDGHGVTLRQNRPEMLTPAVRSLAIGETTTSRGAVKYRIAPATTPANPTAPTTVPMSARLPADRVSL